ncbi:unnamed protein product [Urochloa humidicola]
MAAPAAGAAGNAGAMSRAELVKLWEDLIDNDPEGAEELFFASLLRDARAQYGAQNVVGKDDGDDGEERRRRARVFRPWQPRPPGSALPPPVPSVPAAAPPAQQDVVLGLRAPPHLVARRHERTTPSAPAARAGRPWEPPIKETPAV